MALTKPKTSGILHKSENLELLLDRIIGKIASVLVSDYNTLKDAIEALPSRGGTVFVPEGRFEVGNYNYNVNYMSKANVSIIGAKMPVYNSTLTRLEGGSVLTGRFNAWADNFSVENVGFDLGKDYCDSRFPGADTTASYPTGGTWDAFAFASPNNGTPPRKNVTIRNVVGLLNNPNTVGHAMLCEGIRGGFIDNIVAIYGIHGAVFKVMETNVHGVRSYGQLTNGVIIKSDTYAPCGRSHFSGLIYMPSPEDSSPWTTSPSVQSALNINTGLSPFIGGIQVDGTYALKAERHVNFSGNFRAADFAIDNVITDGAGSTQWSIIMLGAKDYLRVNVGSVIATNCQNAVYCQQETATNDPQLRIGNLQLTNITGDCLVVGGRGCVTVDNFDANNVGSAYNLTGATAKIYVGKERVVGLTGTKFKGFMSVLVNSWVEYGSSNSKFELVLSGFRAHLKGLVRSGTANTIAAIPEGFLPAETLRFPIVTQSGANGVTIDASGVTMMNATSQSGHWVSLDGLSWKY